MIFEEEDFTFIEGPPVSLAVYGSWMSLPNECNHPTSLGNIGRSALPMAYLLAYIMNMKIKLKHIQQTFPTNKHTMNNKQKFWV